MSVDLRQALREARTNVGETLLELSERGPTLLVFLRHFGCTFCREAASDLARDRARIESAGVRLAFAHTGTERDAETFFRRYGLEDAPSLSDPEGALYEAFGLMRGGARQLFGPRVWVRGFGALLQGHGVGRLAGDGFRMPGVFLISRGEVVRAFRHGRASDRPDYCELARTEADRSEAAA